MKQQKTIRGNIAKQFFFNHWAKKIIYEYRISKNKKLAKKYFDYLGKIKIIEAHWSSKLKLK